MKISIIVLSLLSLTCNSFAQFMGYLTKLDDSIRESAFCEVTLIHRSREAPEKFIDEVGSTSFMIPRIVNGKEMILNHDHFNISTGSAFIKDSNAYIQAFLYYDNGTIDPRDDEFIIALPFKVNKDLMDKELQYYMDRDYIDYGFVSSKE